MLQSRRIEMTNVLKSNTCTKDSGPRRTTTELSKSTKLKGKSEPGKTGQISTFHRSNPLRCFSLKIMHNDVELAGFSTSHEYHSKLSCVFIGLQRRARMAISNPADRHTTINTVVVVVAATAQTNGRTINTG